MVTHFTKLGLVAAVSLAPFTAIAAKPLQDVELQPLATYDSGLGEGAAEIVAYDATTQRLFIVNATTTTVDVLDISNPGTPELVTQIDATALGNGANSVAAHNGKVAVAIQAEIKQAAGTIALYDAANLELIATYTAGALPDMVTFTHDGNKILVANEGEPSSDYTLDPEGTVTIIDLGTSGATQLGFTDFNIGGPRADELPDRIRVFGPTGTGRPAGGARVAQDLEPEYIAVSPDSKTAWVSLQENNGIAEIDLKTNTITRIVALGTKDYSAEGNEIDASDKDGTFNLRNYTHTVGMYQPDAIATYRVKGVDYLVTANEGDARDYWFDAVDRAACEEAGGIEFDDEDGCLAFTEEVRFGKLDAVADHFSAPEALTRKALLGRLKVTTTLGQDDGGVYQTAYSYGARSFSIWGPEGQVFDSGSEIATITQAAGTYPDKRSDDKGSEPESVVIGKVQGRVYAFIGLERAGGVMVYDITDPADVSFKSYQTGGSDVAPEGLAFISEEASPTGRPMLAVANEVSGTTTLYEIAVTSAAK
ncbi:MAG: choice-of-anchor I family protein [Gammaproteobacteria bacterium]|nr:choice-of-anchor I family protein [Gammaproteobacteria bacterium]